MWPFEKKNKYIKVISNVIVSIKNGDKYEGIIFENCEFKSYKGLSVGEAFDLGLLTNFKFKNNKLCDCPDMEIFIKRIQS